MTLLRRTLLAAIFFAPLLAGAAPNIASQVPTIVVLTDSGKVRDGLPVLLPHPEGRRIAARLERGLDKEFAGVYRLVQIRRQRTTGSAIEPAYLLESERQGGFAKYGFYLGNVKKGGVAYVDVHKSWALDGEFGSVDQIFPHELAHAIFHQLGLEPRAGDGSNQVHAIALRTDRFTAFNEGFAEHLQVMAIDHAGAAPGTQALGRRTEAERTAQRRLGDYRRELTARFAPAPRMMVAFPAWYSNDERVLRYFAVKRNAFAREPSIPPRLLNTGDRYPAYLIENTMTGDPAGAIKPVSQMIASEGVVATLFYRWASNAALQHRYRDEAFYEQFGATSREVSPLQNVYLKLFDAMARTRPHNVVELVNAYKATFPDEASLVDAVTSDVFLGQPVAAPAELWLANDSLRTGTTLFDQFRGVPRVHTFDLNSATVVDLTSVEGVTPALARTIRQHAPYASVEDLQRVPGIGHDLVARMRTMRSHFAKLQAMDENSLSMSSILMPYAWRLLAVLGFAAVAGAVFKTIVLHRGGTTQSTTRLIVSGAGAALAGMIASWVSGSGALAVLVVLLLFGVPAAAWQLLKKHSRVGAAAAALSWAAAAIPAAIVTTPWF